MPDGCPLIPGAVPQPRAVLPGGNLGVWQVPAKATCLFWGLLQPIHHERAWECQGSPRSHPGHPCGRWVHVVKSLPGMERSGLEGRRSLCSLTKGIFFHLACQASSYFDAWKKKKEQGRREGEQRVPEATCSLGREQGQQGTCRDLVGAKSHEAGLWDCPCPPSHADTGSDTEDGWGAKDQRWSAIPLETAWRKLLPHCWSEPRCPAGGLGKRNCLVKCYIILGVS